MFIPERIKSRLPKKKTKEELDNHFDEIELEKGDLPAMIIAALITFLPVLIITLLVVYGLVWLIFL